MLPFLLMDKPKRRAIQTDLDLKDYVHGAGVLCLGLYDGDFISIGASTFIGFSRVKANMIRIGVVSPEIVQRFELIVNPIKLDDRE